MSIGGGHGDHRHRRRRVLGTVHRVRGSDPHRRHETRCQGARRAARAPARLAADDRRTFEDKLREHTARAILPHDPRRTYANWLEAAGITRTRRRLYMGHGVGDVIGLYELHEVASFLAADGATLRAFVGVDPTPAFRLHSEKSGSAHTIPHTIGIG